MNDYYDILGVPRDASQDDIKRAFRKLAHQHHPDKQGGDVEKFKEINSAYQVLGNPEKRGQYDQLGHAAFERMGGAGGQGGAGFGGFDFSGFGGAQGFGGFEDIIENIINMTSGGGARSGRGQQRGRHIEMDVALTFEEAAFGADRAVAPHRTVTCSDCGGTGAEKGSALVTCSDCRGHGKVRAVQQTILGSFQVERTCGRCAGQGKTPEKSCRACGGQGVRRESREISVKIPAGIGNGEVLRVSGEGEAVRGGVPGDLYLNIRVRKHDRFTRDGFDVHSEEEISFARAALGGDIDALTLDGTVALKIPAGTQPGTVFRLKGKGVPFLKRSGRGDHYVTVTVRVPTKLTREQRKALEEWEL